MTVADVSAQKDTEAGRPPDTLPHWIRVVVAVALARTAIALVLYFSAPLPIVPRLAAPPAVLPPWWLYAALSTTFTALGAGLVLSHRRDIRAAWLGAVLTLAGVPFATPLLLAAWPGAWLVSVHPETFSAAALWFFVAQFPTRLRSPAAARIFRLLAVTAALFGLWCLIASVASIWVGSGNGWRWLMAFAVRPGNLYWPTLMVLAVLAFAALLWRAAMAEGEARHRIRLFVSGLLAGFAPITLEVLLEELVPAYKTWAYSPAVARWIGSGIFGVLAIVPVVTTYSVLFDRVVDVRVVLRAAAQYILARYSIVAITLVPFAALTIFLSEHRAEPIVSLVTGTRPLILGSVIAAGLVSLRLRGRWLEVLDRRYFRESYQAHDILARVVGRQTRDIRELATEIRGEIEGALHADAEVFLADDVRTGLHHVDERLPSLAMGSKIVALLLADARPMDIDLEQRGSLLLRLPDEERRWLRSGHFSLLISLRRSSGILEGILALGHKRSGLPFSDEDRRFLDAIGSIASLTFDSTRLRGAPPAQIDRPARECLQCRRLTSFDAEGCECGGSLVIANVPHVLRGVFRFKQRIGAGGMGVVYRAADLSLGRDVAIKALPRATPDLVARLRHEARAMASVTHPNLAVIFGVETWQGMPFLVQEFVAGGTLTQRLAAMRPSIVEALDLGITLSRLLQHMHASGVIHCDIKPSNIGFTQHGTVKLLDFGLARVLHEALSTTGTTMAVDPDADPADTMSYASSGWFGTPLYMSPEAAGGEPPAPSFDLWALTVVLYQALSGGRPFDGKDASEILARIRTEPARDIRDVSPDVPPSISAFFDAALARAIARRPPDAAAFTTALLRLRDGIR